MIRLITLRLAWGVVTLLAVTLAVFALAASPQDPLEAYLGVRYQFTSPDLRAQIGENLGIGAPWIVHWWNWISAAFQGDWGYSRLMAQPVTTVLAERLPYSLILGGVGLLVAALAAILADVIAVRRPGGIADRIFWGTAHSLQAVPPVVLALLASLASIAVRSALSRTADPSEIPWGWAIAVVALSSYPWLTITLRQSLEEALASSHVQAAVGRGLNRSAVVGQVFSVSWLPFAASVGQIVPSAVGGSLIVETVFGIPGIADAAVRAALGTDFALLAPVTVVTCALALLGSLAADIAALAADPRVRGRADAEGGHARRSSARKAAA